MSRTAITALLVLLALGAPGLRAQAPAPQAPNRFWLANDSGRTILAVFVSAARMPDWGDDILGTAVLPAGRRSWVVPDFPDCLLDLRVVFEGGGEERRMGVNACRLSQIVIAPPAGPPAGR